MRRQLRVAIVGPYPVSEDRVSGGVEGVTSALAAGLAGVEDVEVHAVTSVRGISEPAYRVTGAGVHVHSLPLFGKFGCLTGFAVDAGRIRGALRQIEPDIVHAHTQLVYAHAVVDRGWPSVLTAHGIYHRETASKRGYDWLQTRLGCAYAAKSMRRAGHISAINRYSARAYGDQIRTSDIRYIDNPIDDRYFDVVDQAEPGRILLGGFIYDLKNHLYLLDAASRLTRKHPNLRLRLAGAVSEPDYHARCVAFVSEHGMESNVEFLGPLSVDDMLEEQSRASIVALTSKQENAPMIISEAMAAGNPVIATDVGGISEMVEHDKSGYVVPLDEADELASRIDCLLSDDQLRKSMGEAGKAIAEQRFRRSVVAAKTIEFYKDVIEYERSRRGG